MKIAYLSHTEWYLRNFRLSWMKSLVSRGYTVYGVVQKKEAENYLEKEGIPVIRYPIERKSVNPIHEIVTILSLYRIFKKLKPTILHTFLHKPNLYGTIAGRLAHVPIIINHIPGLGYIYTEQNDVKVKFYRFIISRLYRHCFKYADKVIFHNKDDLNEFAHLTDNRDKFMVIKGTGVNVEFFSPDKVPEAHKK
ncbi:MAG: glycosyltransferase family 1 protein, partial [Thermoprotei archaeon]